MEEDYLDGPLWCYLSWCRELSQRLTPEVFNQHASSRQGQLLVAAFGLHWELRNAGANWDDYPELFAAYEDFVTRQLCDGTFDARVCVFVGDAIDGLNKWMNREPVDCKTVYHSIARVYTLAHHWCRLHPDPIPPVGVPWETA